ncbi:MAG TPA: NADH-quinone oxidoreductase subunit J [Trueperaceae bacterium]|nr:NADH-quinone oxidoreductase subunit J [Trueperaceae bacterium]
MIGFAILAVVAVAGALLVVTARQPVHAALALVGTLLSVAVAYVMLDAHFLAAIQVIVYAGAIMVLFLFVIMLLNVERQPGVVRWPWLRPVGYGVGLLGAVAVGATVLGQTRAVPDQSAVDAVLQGGSPERIGTVLFSEYLLAFHLVAVLLLTGVIAAVSLVQRSGDEADAESVPTVIEAEPGLREPA